MSTATHCNALQHMLLCVLVQCVLVHEILQHMLQCVATYVAVCCSARCGRGVGAVAGVVQRQGSETTCKWNVCINL